MDGYYLMSRLASDEDRKIWPHAMHVVTPVIVPPWQLNPPSQYASRWEHEQHAKRVARFWGKP